MSNLTDYSRNDASHTETTTHDDSENSDNSDSAATQKDVLSIIFFYRILLYIIPIDIFL